MSAVCGGLSSPGGMVGNVICARSVIHQIHPTTFRSRLGRHQTVNVEASIVDMTEAVDMLAHSIVPPFHLSLSFVIPFVRTVRPNHNHQYRRYQQTFTAQADPILSSVVVVGCCVLFSWLVVWCPRVESKVPRMMTAPVDDTMPRTS